MVERLKSEHQTLFGELTSPSGENRRWTFSRLLALLEKQVTDLS